MNLFEQQAKVMKLARKANAEALTDADVKSINKAGLRLVHKPDAQKTNVVSLDDRRVMAAHTSPEAA
jgi:hypothetical protein